MGIQVLEAMLVCHPCKVKCYSIVSKKKHREGEPEIALSNLRNVT